MEKGCFLVSLFSLYVGNCYCSGENCHADACRDGIHGVKHEQCVWPRVCCVFAKQWKLPVLFFLFISSLTHLMVIVNCSPNLDFHYTLYIGVSVCMNAYQSFMQFPADSCNLQKKKKPSFLLTFWADKNDTSCQNQWLHCYYRTSNLPFPPLICPLEILRKDVS